MSEDTEKTTAKKTAAKTTAAKKSGASKATAKKGTSKTKMSKKKPKKIDAMETDTIKIDTVEIDSIEIDGATIDMVEADTAAAETKSTKTKRAGTAAKKTTTKKASTKKTASKRASSPKIEIVDATDSAIPATDEPIVIEDPVVAIQVDDGAAGSSERHGGFLNMLYRHPRDRMVSGVCGGIADYLGWDAMLVRVLWAVASVMTLGFAGVVAYGILSLLLPVGSKHEGFVRPGKIEMTEQNLGRASYGLIGVGVLMLLSNIGLLSWLFAGARAVVGVIFWPAVLVTIGLLLLNRNGDKNYQATLASGLNTVRERAEHARANGSLNMPEASSLRASFERFRSQMPFKRSRTDRMIAGVCGGIGRAVGLDANLVRLGLAVMTVATGGFPLLIAYFALSVLLPSDGSGRNSDKLKEEITIIEHM